MIQLMVSSNKDFIQSMVSSCNQIDERFPPFSNGDLMVVANLTSFVNRSVDWFHLTIPSYWLIHPCWYHPINSIHFDVHLIPLHWSFWSIYAVDWSSQSVQSVHLIGKFAHNGCRRSPSSIQQIDSLLRIQFSHVVIVYDLRSPSSRHQRCSTKTTLSNGWYIITIWLISSHWFFPIDFSTIGYSWFLENQM